MIAAIFLLLILFTILCLFCRSILLNLAKATTYAEEIIPPYAVLSVKNCEGCIEALLRSFAWQMKLGECKNCLNTLLVVDLGSEDNTSTIVEKLSLEYPFICSMNIDEYKKTVGE